MKKSLGINKICMHRRCQNTEQNLYFKKIDLYWRRPWSQGSSFTNNEGHYYGIERTSRMETARTPITPCISEYITTRGACNYCFRSNDPTTDSLSRVRMTV